MPKPNYRDWNDEVGQVFNKYNDKIESTLNYIDSCVQKVSSNLSTSFEVVKYNSYDNEITKFSAYQVGILCP